VTDWLHRYSLTSGPSSATRRGRTRTLRIGPVTSQAAPTRPPQALELASDATKHLTHRAILSVEGRKLGHGKGALAVAPRRKAIDGQIEAGQLMQRAGEDGGALSAG
jgi:hypothetical protein